MCVYHSQPFILSCSNIVAVGVAHSNLLRSVALDRVSDGSSGLAGRASLQVLDVAGLLDLARCSILLAGGQNDALAGWVGGDIDGSGVDEAVVVERVGVLRGTSPHSKASVRVFTAIRRLAAVAPTHSQVALLGGQLLSDAGALDQLAVVVA